MKSTPTVRDCPQTDERARMKGVKQVDPNSKFGLQGKISHPQLLEVRSETPSETSPVPTSHTSPYSANSWAKEAELKEKAEKGPLPLVKSQLSSISECSVTTAHDVLDIKLNETNAVVSHGLMVTGPNHSHILEHCPDEAHHLFDKIPKRVEPAMKELEMSVNQPGRVSPPISEVSKDCGSPNLLDIHSSCLDLSTELWVSRSKQTAHLDMGSPTAHQVFDKRPKRTGIENGGTNEHYDVRIHNSTTAEPTSETKKLWSDIVGKPFPTSNLKYIQPVFKNGEKLQLPCGLAQLGEDKWKNCITGYFIEKSLPFSIVKEQANRLWHRFGLLDTLSSQKGVFIFKFDSASSCQCVLNKGPWVFSGKPMWLKLWTKEVDLHKNDFKTMDIWTNLYNIPLAYWTEQGLATIASRIGIPKYLDEPTTQGSRITFARVCIEIPLESNFPTSFEVTTEFGEDFEVKVEYSWIPRKCTDCKVFGHNETSCPKAKKKEWRQRQQGIEMSPVDGNVSQQSPSVEKSQDADWTRVPSKSKQTSINTKQSSPIEEVNTTKKLTITNNFDTLSLDNTTTGNDLQEADVEAHCAYHRSVLEDISNDSQSSASPTTTALSKKIKLVDEVDARKKRKKGKNKLLPLLRI